MTVVHDGLEALKRAQAETFDAILLDVMLPGKDGFEVCRELRRGGVRTPILMLTARAQEAEKVLGLEVGCRRLRDQAVRHSRAARAHCGAAAAESARGDADDGQDWRSGSGPRSRRDQAWRRDDAAHAAGVPAAPGIHPRARQDPDAGAVDQRSLGAEHIRDAIASSTITSAACARSSSPTSTSRDTSRTCAGSGIASNHDA